MSTLRAFHQEVLREMPTPCFFPLVMPGMKDFFENLMLFDEIGKFYALPRDVTTFLLRDFAAPYFLSERENFLIDLVHREKYVFFKDKVLVSQHTRGGYPHLALPLVLGDPFMVLDARLQGNKLARLVGNVHGWIGNKFISELRALPLFDRGMSLGDTSCFMAARRYKLDSRCSNMESYVINRTETLKNEKKWGNYNEIKELILYLLEKNPFEEDLLVEWYIILPGRVSGAHIFEFLLKDQWTPASSKARIIQIKEKARSPEYKERRIRFITEGSCIGFIT